jgi:hypothetical protein
MQWGVDKPDQRTKRGGQALPLLEIMRKETQRLESIYEQKLAALEELKKSLLQQAFNGAL